MDASPLPPAPPRLRSRRALLGASAAIAAAGAAAAVITVADRSGGDGGAKASAAPEGAAASPSAAAVTAIPANMPIDDPLRRAAHLLRRAGFSGTRAQVEEFAKLSRDDAADRLLNYETVDNSALDARITKGNFNLVKPGRPPAGQGQIYTDIIRWWMTRIAYTARPLEERMVLIWHGLLTSQVSQVGGGRAKLMVQQNELFRANALGRYDDLVKAVAHDPAMMIYLNTDESTAEHPNENFPRELMELFTMGVGNYTEQDVRESARAFTGWRISPPPRVREIEATANLTQQERQELRDKSIAEWDAHFVFNPRLHDNGTKTFLGRTGAFDGDDIIGVIMEQPATGRFIATRLFTEFANFNPDKATVDALVKVWDESNHSIKALVRAILVSDAFYSEASYRAFVRSPIEFATAVVRSLELETDMSPFIRFGRTMDQVPFEPPSVAGWPGGETWLSSSTFFARANFLDTLFFNRGRPLAIPSLAGITATADLVDAAVASLLNGDVASATKEAIATFADGVRPQERAQSVAYLVAASPEFQLG